MPVTYRHNQLELSAQYNNNKGEETKAESDPIPNDFAAPKVERATRRENKNVSVQFLKFQVYVALCISPRPTAGAAYHQYSYNYNRAQLNIDTHIDTHPC